MPKKLSTNPKALEARIRKEEKKKAEAEKIEKLKEDAYWRDDDKHASRKLQRKEEKEQKKIQQKEKKAANKAAYNQEMESLKPTQDHVQTKITRSQIEINLINQKAKQEKEQKKSKLKNEIPIQENINRVQIDGLEARGIEEAIKILSVSEETGDRHPEKRMKAAFTEFEERNLPKLKAENPNLRMSQLQQMLRKDWLKSPDNPLNKSRLAYNAKT